MIFVPVILSSPIPTYCTELAASDRKEALRAADRSRAGTKRDSLIKEFMAAGRTLLIKTQ